MKKKGDMNFTGLYFHLKLWNKVCENIGVLICMYSLVMSCLQKDLFSPSLSYILYFILIFTYSHSFLIKNYFSIKITFVIYVTKAKNGSIQPAVHKYSGYNLLIFKKMFINTWTRNMFLIHRSVLVPKWQLVSRATNMLWSSNVTFFVDFRRSELNCKLISSTREFYNALRPDQAWACWVQFVTYFSRSDIENK